MVYRALIIAERAGRIVGYAWFETLAGVGYVRHLVVDSGARGIGLGRALMLAARDRARESGALRWCLNVDPDNTVARRLYESLGLVPVYESAALRLPWSLVDTLPLGEALEVSIPPDPAWDEDVESALDVAPGLLASGRPSDAHPTALSG